MLIALWFGSSLLLAGQLWTQAPQPVQSSGATWRVYFIPLNSGSLQSVDLKVVGRLCQQLFVVGLHADGGMRADEGADAALDAELFVPDRDVDGDVALLVLRGGGREGAVGRHLRDRQVVAEAGDDRPVTSWTNCGAVLATGGGILMLAGGLGRNLDFVDVLQGFVDGGVVHGDDLVAGFAVALLDGALDLADGRAPAG